MGHPIGAKDGLIAAIARFSGSARARATSRTLKVSVWNGSTLGS